MDEFHAEAQRRSTRNLAKLRQLQADVRRIAQTMNRVVSAMDDTNRILQSLPLYRAQLAREAHTSVATPAPSAASVRPALRLVASNA